MRTRDIITTQTRASNLSPMYCSRWMTVCEIAMINHESRKQRLKLSPFSWNYVKLVITVAGDPHELESIFYLSREAVQGLKPCKLSSEQMIPLEWDFFFFPFRELSMHHALLDLRRHINWIGYPFRALTWPIDVAWDVQAATPSTGSELVVTSLVSNLLQLIKILYQERDVSARAKMFVTFSFFSLEIIKRDHLTVP